MIFLPFASPACFAFVDLCAQMFDRQATPPAITPSLSHGRRTTATVASSRAQVDTYPPPNRHPFSPPPPRGALFIKFTFKRRRRRRHHLLPKNSPTLTYLVLASWLRLHLDQLICLLLINLSKKKIKVGEKAARLPAGADLLLLSRMPAVTRCPPPNENAERGDVDETCSLVFFPADFGGAALLWVSLPLPLSPALAHPGRNADSEGHFLSRFNDPCDFSARKRFLRGSSTCLPQALISTRARQEWEGEGEGGGVRRRPSPPLYTPSPQPPMTDGQSRD